MKGNIIVKIAAAFLCLTLVSTSMVCGMLAKYVVQAESTDTARVAQFGELTLEETPVEKYQLLPGVAVAKDPKVTMTASEVAVRVYVNISLGSGWTMDTTTGKAVAGTDGFISWTVADGWTYEKQEGSTYTFYRDLPAGESLAAEVLLNNAVYVSETITYAKYYAYMQTFNADPSVLDISIAARAVQID